MNAAAVIFAIDLLESSSSDTSSEEEEIETLLHAVRREDKLTDHQYVENVASQYTENDFIRVFRVQRCLAKRLMQQFHNSPWCANMPHQGGGRPRISSEKHILAFLWYVGHEGTSYRDLCDMFDLTCHSVQKIINRVTGFLLEIAKTVISWPSENEIRETQEAFQKANGIANIIGCLDGCHFRIDPPKEDAIRYLNKGGYHSIHMQAICDSNQHFIDVYIGLPGAVEDDWVFRNSPIFPKLSELCKDGYVIADGGFPGSPWCLTPFTGCLEEWQQRFNNLHDNTRLTVENACRALRHRFPFLRHIKSATLPRVVDLIHACCVLHNMASGQDLLLLEELTGDMPADPLDPNDCHLQPPSEGAVDPYVQELRKSIAVRVLSDLQQ